MDLNLGYRFLLVALIIALNAFFSGAEVALLSVRQSRLKQLADEGHAGAAAALSLLANPEKLLSVVQVGVTLASLGLGWAGEDTVFYFLNLLLAPLVTPATRVYLHGASFTLAFLIITYAHVVLGEVVPKNLAIEKSDRLAALVSPPLLLFYRIAGPFVSVIEKSAGAVSRVMGLRGEQAGSSHTPEEIKFIAASSRRHGHLAPFVEESLQRLLDLAEFSAREIMVPRSAFVIVPVEATLDDLLQAFSENKYSRVLVYEGVPENVIGFVFAKDLMEVWHQRRGANEKRRPALPFDLRRLLRQPIVVPETKPLTQLVDSFRRSHSHMAIVVDEFGSVTGLLTLEDVLEQIFGEIEDEHDVRLPPLPIVWEALDLDGSTSIRDLETQYGIEVPSNAGFETLAGFLLFRLGTIPNVGAEVTHGELRFTVQGMEHNRVSRVKVDRIPAVDYQGSAPG
ncbi:MAG: HlyC/CorC family transporter [Acidobacteriia bacterium]|nr:HlyC/CorC family transporter [Terriglobia bacterium]